MNLHNNTVYHNGIYYRLIALWVICEAFAGGIMHAAKLPFTGMIISSLAVTCIVLIAYHVPFKLAILKATLIVVLFKLMLSPHTPPTAYIAVLFQGLMGQLLFSSKKYFRIASVTLAILSLVESALQRILVLTIIYGNDLWTAVNVFLQKLTGKTVITSYSFLIALTYIIVHAFVGFFIGLYAARIAKDSAEWNKTSPQIPIRSIETERSIVIKTRKQRKKIKYFFIFIWLLLITFYLVAYTQPAYTILPQGLISRMLFRSLMILLTWYILLAPLSRWLIKYALRKQKSKYREELQEVMQLLPNSRHIFKESFRLSGQKKGLARMKLFLKILISNILSDGNQNKDQTAH